MMREVVQIRVKDEVSALLKSFFDTYEKCIFKREDLPELPRSLSVAVVENKRPDGVLVCYAMPSDDLLQWMSKVTALVAAERGRPSPYRVPPPSSND